MLYNISDWCYSTEFISIIGQHPKINIETVFKKSLMRQKDHSLRVQKNWDVNMT